MKGFNFVALGIAGAVVYIAASGMVKNPVAQTAMIAVGAVGIANQLPLVSSIVRGQSPLPSA